jgi:hypothetical protein
MSKSTLRNIRSVVTDDEFGGFRITIPPSPKAWVGTAAAVVLWAIVLLCTIQAVRSPTSRSHQGLSAVQFLFLWIASGVGILSTAAFNWLRRDTLIFDGKLLVLRREFACFFPTERAFALAEIRNLRPSRQYEMHDKGGRIRADSVVFDYRGKTYRIGYQLYESEAIRLVKTIRERFPIRDDWSEAEPLPVVK